VVGGIGCTVSSTHTCGAAGLAVDGADDLYVVDAESQRVLEFTQPRSFKGTPPEPASLVFGQGSTGKNFTGGGCNQGGVSANTLCSPRGVAVDTHNNLYVADFQNNRVLVYDRPVPFFGGTPGKPGAAGDVTADLVFGQGAAGKTFNTNFCNGASGFVLSALTLCGPAGLSVDPFNTLFVSDTVNNRVLAYKESANPPANVTAQLEFGQGTTGTDFTHNGANACGRITN
jgi:sugar lactone lactonase YvrE